MVLLGSEASKSADCKFVIEKLSTALLFQLWSMCFRVCNAESLFLGSFDILSAGYAELW